MVHRVLKIYGYVSLDFIFCFCYFHYDDINIVISKWSTKDTSSYFLEIEFEGVNEYVNMLSDIYVH